MPQPAAVPAAEPDAEPTPETIVPEPSATPAPSSAPAEPAETVKPEEPQEQTEYWAVLNLIATVITSLIGLGMLITFFRKKKDDEEAENTDGVTRTDDQNSEAEDENRRRKSKLLGLIPAAASIILFALTENMTNQMGLTDKWTIWMAALCLINIVLAYLTRNRTKDDSESKPENESAA
jgi:heme/copper-type cytochrome/quinol oxidase subunit 2